MDRHLPQSNFDHLRLPLPDINVIQSSVLRPVRSLPEVPEAPLQRGQFKDQPQRGQQQVKDQAQPQQREVAGPAARIPELATQQQVKEPLQRRLVKEHHAWDVRQHDQDVDSGLHHHRDRLQRARLTGHHRSHQIGTLRPYGVFEPRSGHLSDSASICGQPVVFQMDGLVQDFNTALEETAGSNNSSDRSNKSRRKTWKRRCKSTSNLLQLGQQQQHASEDSSSSVDNLGLHSRDRGGTSSLQLSDSDVEAQQASQSVSRSKASRLHDSKKKKGTADNLLESGDSVTENVSQFKEFRVNSKRKRRFKRLAVDRSSETSNKMADGFVVVRSPVLGTKRKKVRSRSGCDPRSSGTSGRWTSGGPGGGAGSGSGATSSSGNTSGAQMVVPGKRKRSAREKSADSGDLLGSGSGYESGRTIRGTTRNFCPSEQAEEDSVEQMETGAGGQRMEEDEEQSSSSLSSSEWEDIGSDQCLEEADDEQSDWPGPEPTGMSVMQLTDEEQDPEISFPAHTAAARRGGWTRGRAASGSCGYSRANREIKAGTRRLRGGNSNPSEAFSKTSLSDTVSRFLQDPSAHSVHLGNLRPSDRNLVLNLASLYSLSWKTERSNLILTKNKSTSVRSGRSEFAVPGVPSLRLRPATSTPAVGGASTAPGAFATTDLGDGIADTDPSLPVGMDVAGYLGVPGRSRGHQLAGPSTSTSSPGIDAGGFTSSIGYAGAREKKKFEPKRQRRTPPLGDLGVDLMTSRPFSPPAEESMEPDP